MTTHSRSLKRWTMILGLTLCALVAGMSYLMWQDSQRSVKQQQTPTDVRSIRIQRENFPEITITRQGTDWLIDSPCTLPANDQRLTPLLSALQPGGQQYDAAEVDLQASGLETPMAIVFLNKKEYRIGDIDIDGDRRYSQLDNTVYFIPEWVLSLVNGGVTALAQLELFASPLNHVQVVDDQVNMLKRSTLENIDTWQDLSAQQITTWPIDDVSETPTYSLTATTANGSQRLIKVFETDRFTAIRLDDARCAYIIEPDALPD